MDRIIDEGELGDKIYYLVKWKSLSYDDCTWEPRELVLDVNINIISKILILIILKYKNLFFFYRWTLMY